MASSSQHPKVKIETHSAVGHWTPHCHWPPDCLNSC